MKWIRILILSNAIALSGLSFAQTSLSNKIFLSGSDRHFKNDSSCDFSFQCDCCMGKFLFTGSSNFIMINYCTSDLVITKGTYEISDEFVKLNFDGARVDVKYNWDLEVNPNAEPAYFIQDSTISKFVLKYRIAYCSGTLLVDKRPDETFLARETDLTLTDELRLLAKYELDDVLNLK